MLVLHLVSYAAVVVAFLFVTLSLASGLLYVAEVIEEHSQSAKRYGRQAVYFIIGAHILFCLFDRLPVKHTLLGIFCHLVYLSNFSKSWPVVALLSPSFISSCCLVIIDHFTWFFYFADRASHPKHRQPYRPAWDDANTHDPSELSFMDVATFFGLCVWFVPFFLFLSLSANDNALPSLSADSPPMIAQQPPTPTDAHGLPGSKSLPCNLSNLSYNGRSAMPTYHPSARTSILRHVLETILSVFPNVRRSPYQSGRTGSRPNEGIIASPSLSTPPSPAPSTAAQWGTPTQSYFAQAQGNVLPPFSPSSPPPVSPSLRPRPTTPRRGMTAPTGNTPSSVGASNGSMKPAQSCVRRASPAARALVFGNGNGNGHGYGNWDGGEGPKIAEWGPVAMEPASPLGQAFNGGDVAMG